MKRFTWSAGLLASLLAISACAPLAAPAPAAPAAEPAATEAPAETEAMADPGTIVDIAVANPDFSTLVTAVTEAGLVDVLADPNAQWTVFAPTNAAFAALPEGVLDTVLADKELLTRILTYHVVEGVVTSDMVSTMMAPTMEMGSVGGELLGGQLDVQVSDAGVTVNGANVVATDIMASNGVIHVVDAVLLPPDVAAMIGQ